MAPARPDGLVFHDRAATLQVLVRRLLRSDVLGLARPLWNSPTAGSAHLAEAEAEAAEGAFLGEGLYRSPIEPAVRKFTTSRSVMMVRKALTFGSSWNTSRVNLS